MLDLAGQGDVAGDDILPVQGRRQAHVLALLTLLLIILVRGLCPSKSSTALACAQNGQGKQVCVDNYIAKEGLAGKDSRAARGLNKECIRPLCRLSFEGAVAPIQQDQP